MWLEIKIYILYGGNRIGFLSHKLPDKNSIIILVCEKFLSTD